MAKPRRPSRIKASSAIARHRARKARQGFARVEVSVRREDAGIIRQIAAALAHPERRASIRAAMARSPYAGLDFKELLAAAPDIFGAIPSRDRDPDRILEF